MFSTIPMDVGIKASSWLNDEAYIFYLGRRTDHSEYTYGIGALISRR
jgi:hypothetical protein